MEKAFSNYHPIVSFSYFTIILIFSMLFMHPIFVGISLISSIIYALLINGEKALKLNILFGIPMFIFIALANPIFTHRGATLLFYFRGNPITYESIKYGIMSAAMMLSVIMWFSCCNTIITSDKVIYIFGKFIPSIALMISMTLKLIPKLINQTKIIAAAQRTIGFDCTSGNLIARIKGSMRILSILVTWTLEEGVETSDSMRARGYGVKKRTTFSIFIFNRQDFIMLIFIIICFVVCFIGYGSGFGKLSFYPKVAKINFSIKAIFIYTTFLALNTTPIFLEIMEAIKWKSLK